jgi:Putative transposase, YhgA-like
VQIEVGRKMAKLRKRIAANRTPRSENDSVWKETVKEDFPSFMRLFFAPEAEDIDWNKPHKFLDADLRKLTAASQHKNRLADKLVRVEYKDGKRGFLLIHLEIQSYADVEFSRRMFIYFYRIFENNVELEEGDVISIVLLAKEEAAEISDRFEFKKGRFELLFKYPVEKLWEYQSRRADFEGSNNFFYLLIAIHLRSLEAKNQQQMYDNKLEFYKLLLEKGFASEDVVKLYKFLDWSIQMPKYLEARFTAAVEELDNIHNRCRKPYELFFAKKGQS